MNAIEFQAVAHDGVLDIPPEHRRRLDGKTLRVVLVDAEAQSAEARDSLFAPETGALPGSEGTLGQP